MRNNNRSMTALTTASAKSIFKGVKRLPDAGADKEETWGEDEAALFESVQQGRDAIVQLLIDKGANTNARSSHNGWTPLMIAAAEGHTTTVSLLLESGAKANIQNHLGRTALMFAAWYGYIEISAMLLKSGADTNIIPDDEEGITALMAATMNEYKEIVELLLKNGADPNIKDKKGKTALACANNGIKKLLRTAGAKD